MQTPPILAIHGSASSGAMWKPLQQICSPARNVLNPDLLGYGEHQSALISQRTCLAFRAQPLIEVIQQYKSVHLVAHSFGGSVAMEIIKTIPRNIESLTLYDPVIPALFKGSDEVNDQHLLADFIALSKIVAATEGHVGMETFLDFWSVPGAWQSMPQEVKNKLAQLAPMVLRDFEEAISVSQNTYTRIPFNQPVRILVGEKSNGHAHRMAQLLAESLPHSQVDQMINMGHMGPTTHSQQVSQSILEHIEKAEQSSSHNTNTQPSISVNMSLHSS